MIRSLSCLVLAMALWVPGVCRADGTETLGPTPLAAGTDLIGAGIGLFDQPNQIYVDIPAEATVVQAYLYWNGFHSAEFGDPQIAAQLNVGATVQVPGTLIGGSTFFFSINGSPRNSTTYRADITDFPWVAGVNELSLSSLTNNKSNNGASLLLVIDDGTALRELQLADGQDLAFINFAPPLDTTVPQTFSFAPASYERIAEVTIIAGSVAGPLSGSTAVRPNIIRAESGGVETLFADELAAVSGDEWDHIVLEVTIPAGATTLEMQALSASIIEDDTNEPASFAWIGTALSLEIEEEGGEPSEIGDLVYCDVDGNGVFDGADTGIEGVVVNLVCAGPNGIIGDGDDFTAEATTDVNGNYFFNEVPEGACEVSVDLSTIGDAVPGACPTTVTLAVGRGDSFDDVDFCFDCSPPVCDDQCAPCDGKVTLLTLKYNGGSAVPIDATDKAGNVLFSGTVNPGDEFTLNGMDKKGTLGTEVDLVVDCVEIEIHTSCSQPINPGLTFGDLEVVYAESREGGPICALGVTPCPKPDCKPKCCKKKCCKKNKCKKGKCKKGKKNKCKKNKCKSKKCWGKKWGSKNDDDCDDDDDDNGKSWKCWSKKSSGKKSCGKKSWSKKSSGKKSWGCFPKSWGWR
ncbi:MAG: SdrD B-like domain-containing protein [Planctomycetota bacterium]